MSRGLPIRWRLTAWYAALLLVVLLLFGAGIYGGLRWRLYSALDGQLAAEAQALLGTVRYGGDRPSLPTEGGMLPASDEYFVRLLDATGSVIAGPSLPANAAGMDSDVIAAVLGGRQQVVTTRVNDDESVRIIAVPVRPPGRFAPVSGVLQVGRSREDINEAVNAVAWALAVAAPIVLAIAAAGGYLLAGRALAPVVAITTLAANVDAQDLHARLRLRLPDDELGRLAATFNGMLERIEVAFEQQRRFTSDAAHELRTPLSLMRSQVDLALARPGMADEERGAFQGLDADLSRLTALVSALLALSRSDAGQVDVAREPFDLAETISTVLDQYAVAAREADVELVDDRTAVPLESDEDLIIQILVNLLDNALSHTPSGGVITAGCRAAGDEVMFWVADTGSGIAADHQSRVFDRFYRVDAGRSRPDGGLGLGLSICRAIVDALDGTIELTSQPGEGTRVVVRLPDRP